MSLILFCVLLSLIWCATQLTFLAKWVNVWFPVWTSPPSSGLYFQEAPSLTTWSQIAIWWVQMKLQLNSVHWGALLFLGLWIHACIILNWDVIVSVSLLANASENSSADASFQGWGVHNSCPWLPWFSSPSYLSPADTQDQVCTIFMRFQDSAPHRSIFSEREV